jgi:hypothetical protein
MAGKFLLIEEAARQLGVTADEIHRFVERKKLFPLRDGATLKFKADEIERLMAESAEQSGTSGLELELDLDDEPKTVPDGIPQGQTIDLELVDSVVVLGSPLTGTSGEPDSLVIGGSGPLAGSSAGDVSMGEAIGGAESIFSVDSGSQKDVARATSGSSNVIGGLESLDLDIDSIAGLSSPALAASTSPAEGSAAGPADSGTLDIDLSGIGGGSQPSNASGLNASGSLVFGSDLNPAGGSGPPTNAGSALSGALDSGLSLEDDDAAVEGIDLGPLDAGLAGSLGKGNSATDLPGEELDFDLPHNDESFDDNDDSASVVAFDTGSGEAGAGDSFFGDAVGESSGFSGDMPLSADAASFDAGVFTGGDMASGMVRDTRFSTWQICGLVCCSLLLLTGGFVMFDLMRTIGSPNDLVLSGPLLNPLSSVFGWR